VILHRRIVRAIVDKAGDDNLADIVRASI
jgi:hypothetical protein